MVFLYSDGTRQAVKHHIKTGLHKKITSSKSLYQFPEINQNGGLEFNRYHIGLRVGNYVWIIFGGIGPVQNHQPWDEQEWEKNDPIPRTLLWSIKKEKWFIGPDLPLVFDSDFKEVCSISVGQNTAFVMNKKYTYSFNFAKQNGQNHKSPPALLDQGNGFNFESCVLHLQKSYFRYNS